MNTFQINVSYKNNSRELIIQYSVSIDCSTELWTNCKTARACLLTLRHWIASFIQFKDAIVWVFETQLNWNMKFNVLTANIDIHTILAQLSSPRETLHDWSNTFINHGL